jgi:hypothetical protein
MVGFKGKLFGQVTVETVSMHTGSPKLASTSVNKRTWKDYGFYFLIAFLVFSTIGSIGKILDDPEDRRIHLAQEGAKTAYVSASSLSVRLCPSTTCPVTNRIYRGQTITVFEQRGDQSRISKYYDSSAERVEFPQITTQSVARWVASEYLQSSEPKPLAQPKFDQALMDSRIAGIPEIGDGGLTKSDVTLLRGSIRVW